MNRYDQFRQDLENRVLFFDGAMGTSIMKYNLSLEADFMNMENCSEILLLTRPDVIREIHASYFEAGADAVETNTFGATSLVHGEYGIPEKAYEINVLGARLAREVAEQYSAPGRLRYVIGSMGPGTKSPSSNDPNLHINFDEMHDFYKEQAAGLIEGGADVLHC